MKHKKKTHEENVPICNKFVSGNCKRIDANCWYIHNHEQEHGSKDRNVEQQAECQQQGFRGVQESLFPPDQAIQMMMETLNKLYLKVEMLQAEKTKNMSN